MIIVFFSSLIFLLFFYRLLYELFALPYEIPSDFIDNIGLVVDKWQVPEKYVEYTSPEVLDRRMSFHYSSIYQPPEYYLKVRTNFPEVLMEINHQAYYQKFKVGDYVKVRYQKIYLHKKHTLIFRRYRKPEFMGYRIKELSEVNF